MISGHWGLEINEILQVIPRGLAELAQLFHAIHCHHDTGYAGFHEPLPTKVSVLVIRLLPLRNRLPDFLSVSASQ